MKIPRSALPKCPACEKTLDAVYENEARATQLTTHHVKKSPPRCHACGEQLSEMFENEYNTYLFDPASGTYKMEEKKAVFESSVLATWLDFGTFSLMACATA